MDDIIRGVLRDNGRLPVEVSKLNRATTSTAPA